VRECCKGDDQSLWEREKFDPRHPKTPQPMVTKTCVVDCIGDIYHHANFSPNRFRGFGSAHAWFRAPRHKWLGYFWGLLRKATAETRAPILTQNTPNDTTRFRGRKCLLGLAKPISKVWTPIFPQNRHFWAPFRRDFDFFRPKMALTLDGSRVNDP